MLDIFRRSVQIGLVTIAYPAQPEQAPEAYRGLVTLQPDRCTGDGACARICPSTAITVTPDDAGGWVWELTNARCVFCGLCAEVCPAAALSLSREFELAVKDPRDLETRVTFRPNATPGAGS